MCLEIMGQLVDISITGPTIEERPSPNDANDSKRKWKRKRAKAHNLLKWNVVIHLGNLNTKGRQRLDTKGNGNPTTLMIIMKILA